MPSLEEVRAYVFGVRLEQARRAAQISLDTKTTYGIFVRLTDAAQWLRFAGLPPADRKSLSRLFTVAIRFLERSSRRSIDLTDEFCDVCTKQIEMADSIILSWTTSLGLQSSAPNWFELGKEIINGEGGDPPHPGRELQARRAWDWHDLKTLKRLMKAIGIRQTDLFPKSSTQQSWLDSLPVRLAEWNRIEVGILRLEESIEKEQVAALKREETSKASLVLQKFQRSILRALKHRALSHKELAATVSRGDEKRLRKKNGLPELLECSLVAHKRGLGYYRPDAMPSDDDWK